MSQCEGEIAKSREQLASDEGCGIKGTLELPAVRRLPPRPSFAAAAAAPIAEEAS